MISHLMFDYYSIAVEGRGPRLSVILRFLFKNLIYYIISKVIRCLLADRDILILSGGRY